MRYAILLLSALCFAPVLYAGDFKPFDGPTPPLELPDLEGELHRVNDYRGRVVVVQFWATYCAPCRTEMPSMNRLLEKMGGKLAILAVNMNEPLAEIQKFVAEVQPVFTVLQDATGAAIQDWKVFAVPSSFVLDPAGKIRYTLYGATEWDSATVKEMLFSLLDTESVDPS